MIERILNLAAGDDPETRLSKIRAFRLILLMAVAAELLKDVAHPPSAGRAMSFVYLGAGLILTACLYLAWRRRWERPATVAAALILAVVYTLLFPATANHQFLALWCMALLACFDLRRAGEQELLLQALRWTTAIIFFYTGFQKLRYGLYFQGEFLAFHVALGSRFAEFLQYVLPGEEVARLVAIGTPAPDSGPYRIEWLPFRLGSYAVMAAEMLLPILLLVRRTRPLALGLSLVVMLVIELNARELIFGAMFVALLLLFARGDPNRKLLPVFGAFFVALLVLRLWIAPGWVFF